MPTIPDVLNWLVTLAAAFAGAWAAFRFHAHQTTKSKAQENIAAGNRALVTLVQHLNTLKLYQNDFIDPLRDQPGRHIEMQPTLPFRDDELILDVRSLEFFLGTSQQRVVLDLILEENRYREAIKTINERSRHLLAVVQPKLSAAGLKAGTPYSEREIRDALGEFDYGHLKSVTDAVFLHVDLTIESLSSMKDRLREALIKAYPNGIFINYQLLAEIPPSRFVNRNISTPKKDNPAT